MDIIENKTFDEIKTGDTASLARTLTKEDIDLFAVMSGDVNPAHLDEEYAKSSHFHHIIAHGMWGGALISTLLGTKLPGPGTIYLGQTFKFTKPIVVGDTITVSVTAVAKDPEKHRITFDCQCINQRGETAITGSALVLAPTEKIKRPRSVLPNVHLHDPGARFRQLIELSRNLPPLRTAVVHPAEAASLRAAVELADAHLIIPVFIGPEPKIRAAAVAANVDLSGFEFVPTNHSHAAAAAAVALARAGKVAALMKGSLPSDELMNAVLAKDTGLTAKRQVSHVYALDVPEHGRLLFLTDALLNIEPTLDEKRDIVQNAIDLTHALGITTPKVAILSAVETVTPKLRSSLEAAALCKMADRGQITGGLVDGPLAFDNAVSPAAAKATGIISPVAGQADILVVPDLESGNMLVKQLEYLADAQQAGIVVGARVPILLNSPVEKPQNRLTSAAIAQLLAAKSGSIAR